MPPAKKLLPFRHTFLRGSLFSYRRVHLGFRRMGQPANGTGKFRHSRKVRLFRRRIAVAFRCHKRIVPHRMGGTPRPIKIHRMIFDAPSAGDPMSSGRTKHGIASADRHGIRMAAPIYSQAEADAMIAMEKRVEYDAWQGSSVGRTTDGEASKEIDASPEDGSDQFGFKIEIRRSDDSEYFSITLKGKIIGRPWEGLCRYDVQDNEHVNPPLCAEQITVDPGVFHRHVYSEVGVRETDKWHACAEILDLPAVPTFDQQLTRLRGAFLEDLKIKFCDSQTQTGFLFDE